MKSTQVLRVVVLLAMLCAGTGGGRSQTKADDLAVVVNPSTPVSDLSLAEVHENGCSI